MIKDITKVHIDYPNEACGSLQPCNHRRMMELWRDPVSRAPKVQPGITGETLRQKDRADGMALFCHAIVLSPESDHLIWLFLFWTDELRQKGRERGFSDEQKRTDSGSRSDGNAADGGIIGRLR